MRKNGDFTLILGFFELKFPNNHTLLYGTAIPYGVGLLGASFSRLEGCEAVMGRAWGRGMAAGVDTPTCKFSDDF